MYLKSQCLAAYAPGLPRSLRKSLADAARSDKALRKAEEGVSSQTPSLKHCSIEDVQKHDTELLKHLASAFNLSYTAFGQKITEPDVPAYGTLTIDEAWGAALAPAPITPSSGDDAAPFNLLAGTVKATYDAHRNISDGNGDGVVVSPGIMSGNTDTRHYWKLTEHIFRYSHHYTGNRTWVAGGAHTVNEAVYVDSWLEQIRFITTLILNADESTSL
ncbi:hypothetical protein EW026_g205 [Hermanssonia centrifuga]|uniref:Uncharacterized protein n=1 Tax=Hermanssonia centrifuga TaxID=98765 RepID=A0A4V3XBN2_9APHY|nr:hypothetical protein EW026_g205 [Hermanssonia centrifuga]